MQGITRHVLKGVACCLSSATFAVALPSQATWHVYPPGLDTTAIIAGAAAGDTVVLHQGLYAGFVATRGVRVVADGVVSLAPIAAFPNGLWAVDLQVPPGETFHMHGISTAFPTTVRGEAEFDGCTLSKLTATNARLHLQGCVVTALINHPLFSLQQSSATLSDCVVSKPGWGGSQVTVEIDAGSVLHASHCELRNGEALGGGPVIRIANGGAAWLSDSQLWTEGLTSCAIDPISIGLLRTDRCVIVQNGSGCATPTPGALLGVTRTAPLLLGGQFAVGFSTSANNLVFVLAAPTLDRVDVPPLLEQPSWLPAASAFAAALLVADASGAAAQTWPVPNNPLLLHATLWIEGLSPDGTRLQVSPPVGGSIR